MKEHAMNGLFSPEEIENAIRSGEIDTVITAFPDHLGRLIGKRTVGDYFLDHVMTRPLHACAYLLTVDMEMTPFQGFELTSWDRGYGDFRMIPDFSTLRKISWLEKTALVLCDLEGEEDDQPVQESPRTILRQQIQLAESRGYSFAMGSELEFYLFDQTYRSMYGSSFRDLRPSTDYLVDYHILGTTQDEPVIRDIRNQMNNSAVPIEFSKGEWGRGQYEINLRYTHPLEMADRHAIYKNGAKEIATKHGKAITFMAKYASEAAGSSCHLHTSMWGVEDQANLLWDEGKSAPSQLLRWFIGGLLQGERELCLLFAPTVNSYKRFRKGSFAPTAISWSVDNRTTCLRCVGHGGSFRVENRLPGADVNPYLSMAATIAAGMYGIEHQIDCGDPFGGDAYSHSGLERVPGTLEEAMEAFRNSAIAEWAFGERVKRFLIHQAEIELSCYHEAVTDWERNRYFERI